MAKKKEPTFIKVKDDYQGLGIGLKSIDLLIMCKIEGFQQSGLECYMTNEQFSNLFGESVSTVKRSLDKLEEMNIIHRRTSKVQSNGKVKKQRVLIFNGKERWKVQNEPLSGSSTGSNVDEERFKNDENEVQNEPIVDYLVNQKKTTTSNADAKNGAKAPEQKQSKNNKKVRSYQDMSLEELVAFVNDYQKIPYKEAAKKYNLPSVSNEIWKEAKEYLSTKEEEVKTAESQKKSKGLKEELEANKDVCSEIAGILECSEEELIESCDDLFFYIDKADKRKRVNLTLDSYLDFARNTGRYATKTKFNAEKHETYTYWQYIADCIEMNW